MTYPPIEHHGVIGDMHTVALVALDGTNLGLISAAVNISPALDGKPTGARHGLSAED
jgi:hypothetical protein